MARWNSVNVFISLPKVSKYFLVFRYKIIVTLLNPNEGSFRSYQIRLMVLLFDVVAANYKNNSDQISIHDAYAFQTSNSTIYNDGRLRGECKEAAPTCAMVRGLYNESLSPWPSRAISLEPWSGLISKWWKVISSSVSLEVWMYISLLHLQRNKKNLC